MNIQLFFIKNSGSTDQNWSVGSSTADGSAKPLVRFLIDLLTRRIVVSCFHFNFIKFTFI